MKLNLKKVLPIAATALMAGITFAHAATLSDWPSPFVQDGKADVTVVVGADASSIDSMAASDFTAALQAALGGVGQVPEVNPAVAKLEASNKLNIDDNLNEPIKTLTDTKLPNLLARGKFRNKEGAEFPYTQRLEITENPKVLYDREDEIGDKPQLYIYSQDGKEFIKYSLVFTTGAKSNIEDSTMKQFIDRTIKILGREYSITDFKVEDGAKGATLTLMFGQIKDTIMEGEAPKKYTLNGKEYTVEVLIIDSENRVKLKISYDGKSETTDILEEGSVYKLDDGTIIGIREVMRQEFAGGKRMVTLYLGAEKLEIYDDDVTDGAISEYEIEINDESIYSVYGGLFMKETVGGNNLFDDGDKWELNRIEILYKPDEDVYILPNKSYVDPAFNAWELQLAGLSTEKTDTIKIEPNGNDKAQLKIPVANGDATIDLIYYDGSGLKLGKDADHPLIIEENPTTAIMKNTYFIVSDGKEETYYLYVYSLSEEKRQVKIKDKVSGSEYTISYPSGVDEGSFVIGSITVKVKLVNANNVEAGIDAIDFTGDGDYSDSYESGSNYYFATPTGAKIQIDPSATTPQVEVTEEKDENNDGNVITTELSWDNVDNEIEIKEPTDSKGYIKLKEIDDTNKYEDYTKYGTKVWYDQDGQGKVVLTYPDEQLVVNAYITEKGERIRVVSGATGGSLGMVTFADTELTPELKQKNLIVIGGSAVNRVAAELLNLPYPTYGSDDAWKTATGVTGDGQALLKIFDNPYATGKIALLVAGWEGPDTRKAATALIQQISGLEGKTSVKLDTSQATAVVIG